MAKSPKKRTKKYHPKRIQYVPRFVASHIEASVDTQKELHSEIRTLMLRLHLGSATSDDFNAVGQYLLLGGFASTKFENDKEIELCVANGLDALFEVETAESLESEVKESLLAEIDTALDLTFELSCKISLLDLRVFRQVLLDSGEERLETLRKKFFDAKANQIPSD